MYFASDAVIAEPASAPSVPPTPMNPYNRLLCSPVKVSDMKPQNTDGTNRLNTAAHTQNTGTIQVRTASGFHRCSAAKHSRQSTKNRYTMGINFRTGKIDTRYENTGFNSSVAKNVYVNKYGNCLMPASAPIASRIERRMK